MKNIIFLLMAISFTGTALGSVKESWTCYKEGSEFLKMSFDESGYSAKLQGVQEDVVLRGPGLRPSELQGEDRPFYDTYNYKIKIDRSFISESGLERETYRTKLPVSIDGYWDCYGHFTDSAVLECTVEVERN